MKSFIPVGFWERVVWQSPEETKLKTIVSHGDSLFLPAKSPIGTKPAMEQA